MKYPSIHSRTNMIISVPSDIGAGYRGSDQGVSTLLALSVKSGIADNLAKRECTVAFADGFTSVYAKNIEKILYICESVCREVSNSLIMGHFPILLSGDHSSATGTIAGIKYAKPQARLGVIWIDAHADLHSPFTSYSGNMHGMSVAAALGEDNKTCLFRKPDSKTMNYWENLKNIGGMNKKVKPSDIVYVTLRDLEQQEAFLINEYGIRNFTTQEMRTMTQEELGIAILEYLKECTDIYLSFDTDSLEGTISKGTGLPVENGIMPNEATGLIATLLKDPKITCFEITELNPRFDINDATTTMVYQIFERAIQVLSDQ